MTGQPRTTPELLLDTLLEDFTSAEIKDLDAWYGKHEMQEEVYSVSYKITTDDTFLQNMMRSVDALPAKTEANLESVNGRSAEFFKTKVLYARRKLIPTGSLLRRVLLPLARLLSASGGHYNSKGVFTTT